jgi:hypothetical protein
VLTGGAGRGQQRGAHGNESDTEAALGGRQCVHVDSSKASTALATTGAGADRQLRVGIGDRPTA